MTADGQPLIRREDDHRVPGLPGLLQRVEDPADLLVHVRHHGVVGRELPASLLGSAGPGEELLVATVEVAVVERMLRQKVGRNLNLIRHITTFPARRYQQGVVGSRERNMQEEGFARAAANELDGPVREVLTDLRRQPHTLLRKLHAIVPLQHVAHITGYRPTGMIDLKNLTAAAHE